MRPRLKLWALLLVGMLIGLSLALISQSCFAQPAKQVDRILIEKSKRTMSLLSRKEVIKSYKVALGGEPVGAKNRQGDHKTPEGIYSVDGKLPNSQFHKALHLSYPAPADRERVRKLGVSPVMDWAHNGDGSAAATL